MKFNKTILKAIMMAVAIVALGSGIGMAQVFSCDAAPGDLTAADDAYDGTIGSMACCTITAAGFGTGTTITDVNLEIQATHTWIGDLTIKVVSPGATTTTVMNRPVYTGPDDGTGCCGDSSDLDGAAITFDDSGVSATETMGSTITGGQFVCTDDGFCSYIPDPDGAIGTNLADFNTEDLVGAWQVCIGDSGSGDTGVFNDASLTFGSTPVELLGFTIE